MVWAPAHRSPVPRCAPTCSRRLERLMPAFPSSCRREAERKSPPHLSAPGIISDHLDLPPRGERKQDEPGCHLLYFQEAIIVSLTGRSSSIIARSSRLSSLGWVVVLLLLMGLSACTTSGAPSPTGGTSSGLQRTLTTTDGALLIQFTITPNHVGLNQFTVDVQDAKSKQPVSHLQVQLLTTMLDMDMGTNTLPLQEQQNGRYSAQGDLSMGGHWEISIELRGSGTSLHKAQVQFTAQA